MPLIEDNVLYKNYSKVTFMYRNILRTCTWDVYIIHIYSVSQCRLFRLRSVRCFYFLHKCEYISTALGIISK